MKSIQTKEPWVRGLELLSKIFKYLFDWLKKRTQQFVRFLHQFIQGQIAFFREFSFTRENIKNHLTQKAVLFFGFSEFKKTGQSGKPNEGYLRFNNKGKNGLNRLATKFESKKNRKKLAQNYYQPVK